MSRDATTAVAGALSATIGAQHRRMSRAWSAAAAGDAAALRHVRIASRRLRETLAVADRVKAARQVSRLRRDVRRLTQALGPLREAAVTLDRFGEASRQHGWPAARVHPVRQRLEKQQRQRRDRLEAFMRQADLRDLARRLSAIAAGLAQVDPSVVEQALATRVLRRARQVSHAATRCGTLYAPDRLHELRIAIKKLRYAVEVGALAGHSELEPILASLTRMQRRLGELHDVQVLHRQARALAKAPSVATRAAGDLVGDALERDCRRLHAQALGDLAALDAVLSDLRRLLAGSAGSRRRMLAAGPSPASGRKAAG